MKDSRREHFDSKTAAGGPGGPAESGIWELPDHVLDVVSGANDFSETVNGGIDFAQGFSCFAQNITDFSQGTPPKVPREFEGGI